MNGNPVRGVRFVLGVFVLLACLGCDQATKKLATDNLRGRPGRSYLMDTVRLEYALNSGGFLSVGNNLSPEVRRWVFVGFNSAMLLGLTCFVVWHWNSKLPVFVAGVSVLAGGIGNLIDRVTNQGLVTDFLNVGLGPVRSGIFNVADMAVTGGVIVLILAMRGEKPRPAGESSRAVEQ
ncbi:MAG: signal peptidase II [Planctomycetales bacterium]